MADSKRHAVAEALILRFTQHLYDSGFTSLLHAWIDVFDPTLTDNVTYAQFAERCNSIGFNPEDKAVVDVRYELFKHLDVCKVDALTLEDFDPVSYRQLH